jgi:hypothetical protein
MKALRAIFAILFATFSPGIGKADEPFFRAKVAPILERRCVQCHGAEMSKGKLRLDTFERALAGGESGKVIEPGDATASLLLDYISGEKPEMPKDAAPLSADEVAAIRKWINQGAKWPKGMSLVDRKPLDTNWWSLRPLTRPPVPNKPEAPAKDSDWPRTPIDSFILAKLHEQNLSPSPKADRRTLIRRLYFDLVGLPPTPAEIEAFAADKNPRAYEAIVDRLLDSPRYGERWARHWLDVVHYGETHGYDKDQPRPNAWPYRDYVIRAFNDDKPYARFIEEQVAGDVLYPGTRDGIEALGFLAAGPWDLIGHAEVPESKTDGKIARHLDRDDMVTNTMQSFNSLTVQCAQCHNHKFDPIPTEDYYSLQAVFAAIDRTNKAYDADPQIAKRRGELMAVQTRLAAERKAIDGAIALQAGQPLIELDRRLANLKKSADRSPAFGYHSTIEQAQQVLKWVQVDLGASRPLATVVLHACHDDFNNIGAGFGFPVRFKVEVCDHESFAADVHVIADHTRGDVENPKLKALRFDAGGRTGRYVRVTATKLALRQNDYIFALAELEAIGPGGRNLAVGKAVTALDSIEAPIRWQKSNLTDGWYAGGPAPVDPALEAVRHERAKLLRESATDQQRERLIAIEREQTMAAKTLGSLPPQNMAYIGAVHQGAGTFAGTGASGGKPRPIFVLPRGNVLTPGREVGPGALQAITALPPRFQLPSGHSEGQRRAALAKWISDPKNPLTWRSIVNRVWLYHFGRGLVDTPGDFGKNGGKPSHPQLLDWLAAEFRDNPAAPGSLKKLHKLIVTSAVYRQVSTTTPQREKIDADNRWLSRMNRRKLEAEAVRDSILFVAGKLDTTMGGPSFQDFVIDKPEHSPHYEYHLHDPDDPRSHRRSVYRFLVRSQQQPFMTVLDCADPSMQVAQRNESVSPLQALSLLNNGLMVTMSRHFAEKLDASGATGSASAALAAKVRRGYYEATSREPSPATHAKLTAYAQQHGLPNLCRVLFNLNEFIFVD